MTYSTLINFLREPNKLAFCFLLNLCLCTSAYSQKATSVNAERTLWLQYMDKVARPVIQNLAENRLRENMIVVLSDKTDNLERKRLAYLEAFGRTLMGIAPWLNIEGGSKDEVALRNQYRTWALKAIGNAVNPSAKDYMKWDSPQPLVDASFVALALIRCPWLWEHLDATVKQQVVAAFKITRATIPYYNNWILFSATIEAFFCKYGLEYDMVRIEYAIRQFADNWYVGDGVYSDGPEYHWDYYNSIVIHPALANIMDALRSNTKWFEWYDNPFDDITKRYAEILERMINTDGSFPATGRSITYRSGAFHHLADIALRKKLPTSLLPAQVRCALTAVLKKTLQAPGTFTNEGWLTIGLYGSQSSLGEFYINNGSVYICSTIFLPLGLPESDVFWSAPAAPWTSVKVWTGQDISADHALGKH